MPFILETIKYRADFMKILGYWLCSPFATHLFNIVNTSNLDVNFHFLPFLLSLCLAILGTFCIILGMLLLDLYAIKETIK